MSHTEESSDGRFALASSRLLSFLKGLHAFFLVTLLGSCLIVKNGLSMFVQASLGINPLWIGAALILIACAVWLHFGRKVRQAADPAIEQAFAELGEPGKDESEEVKGLRIQLEALQKFYTFTPHLTAARSLVCAVLAGVSTLTGTAGWGCVIAMTVVAELMLAKTIRIYRQSMEG
jgi:hypothetical protein